MLIPELYFTPLIVFISIVLAVAVYFVMKRIAKTKSLNYMLIVLGIGAFVLLQSLGKKVYVITTDYQVKEYIAIGSFSVVMEDNNGEKVKGSVALNRVGVVNKSASPLLLQEITYADNSYNNSTNEYKIQEIKLYSIEEVFTRTGKVDYFFEDRLPQKVSVHATKSSEHKYHLFEMK